VSPTGSSMASVNLKPLLPGHVLVITARATATMCELPAGELVDVWETVRVVQVSHTGRTDKRVRSSLCVPFISLLIATRPFSFLPLTPALFGSWYEHMHKVLCRSRFRFRFTTLRLLLACCSHAHVTHALTRLISSLHSTLL
jgi:hypothetical protein